VWCCISLLFVKQIFLLACSHHIAIYFPLAKHLPAALHLALLLQPEHVAKPFDFENKYKPADNINKFNAGTPSVLSLIPVNTGLDLVLEAGIINIRNKSIELGEYLIKIINIELNKFDIKIISPIESKSRGSHITIQHKEAWKICKLLIKGDKYRKRIIPDFRPVNNIRLGFSPLYVSFIDLYETVIAIRDILENKEYLKIDDSKSKVT